MTHLYEIIISAALRKAPNVEVSGTQLVPLWPRLWLNVPLWGREGNCSDLACIITQLVAVQKVCTPNIHGYVPVNQVNILGAHSTAVYGCMNVWIACLLVLWPYKVTCLFWHSAVALAKMDSTARPFYSLFCHASFCTFYCVFNCTFHRILYSTAILLHCQVLWHT